MGDSAFKSNLLTASPCASDSTARLFNNQFHFGLRRNETSGLCLRDLSLVENAFRSLKTVDLKVRPIHHCNADRVRCHLLLCMLAYYVEWHVLATLKPVLFDEDDPEGARASRPDPVAPKRPSVSAKAEARTKQTADGSPVHSFQTLLEDLATLTRNTIVPDLPAAPSWKQDAEPKPQQKKILALLETLPEP